VGCWSTQVELGIILGSPYLDTSTRERCLDAHDLAGDGINFNGWHARNRDHELGALTDLSDDLDLPGACVNRFIDGSYPHSTSRIEIDRMAGTESLLAQESEKFAGRCSRQTLLFGETSRHDSFRYLMPINATPIISTAYAKSISTLLEA
jgi:hypothetical protein